MAGRALRAKLLNGINLGGILTSYTSTTFKDGYMYDQSFNIRTLSHCFKPGDFQKCRKLSLEDERNKVIIDAIERTKVGFLGYQLSSSVVRGKKVYWVEDLADVLVLRKIKNNLIKLNKTRSLPRSVIVDSVRAFVSECSQYKLYRLDVASFYESFDHGFIYDQLNDLSRIDPKTKQLLKEFLYSYSLIGGQGIPRGLSVSAYLSEYFMKAFDDYVQGAKHVFYYARYVDDIVIITDGYEDGDEFLSQLKASLPKGLSFNEGKKYFVSDVVVKSASAKKNPQISELITFEYLGYDFCVSDVVNECSIRGLYRQVVVDLAKAKIKKIKSRIIHSIINYNKNLDFDLLCERLKFLSTNFSVLDANRILKRLSGIHYNYPLIDANNSKGLAELDLFLKKAVLSSNGKVFFDFNINLNQSQKYHLLKFSFVRGHDKCHFFHYSAFKMNRIQGCWKYV